MAIYKITKDVYYHNEQINTIECCYADLSYNDYFDICEQIERHNDMFNVAYKYCDVKVRFNVVEINNDKLKDKDKLKTINSLNVFLFNNR